MLNGWFRSSIDISNGVPVGDGIRLGVRPNKGNGVGGSCVAVFIGNLVGGGVSVVNGMLVAGGLDVGCSG